MQNIYDTAKAAGNFKTFISAVDKCGLSNTLKGNSNYTVFAPTDEAFSRMPKEQMDALLSNPDKLKNVLLYHCIPGKVSSADVRKMKDGDRLNTAWSGKAFTLGLKGGNHVMIDRSKIVKSDIDCSNGCIHAIDTVLMPV